MLIFSILRSVDKFQLPIMTMNFSIISESYDFGEQTLELYLATFKYRNSRRRFRELFL